MYSIQLILAVFTLISTPKGTNKSVQTIHESAITIDTHCDTPMKFVNKGFDISVSHEAPSSRVDIPRMEEGGLDAIFFAVFTGQKERTPENYKEAYDLAYQMIDSTKASLKANKITAQLTLSSNDLNKAIRKNKKAIYLGMENGFPIAKDINRVEEFYKQGIRYLTLCHTANNDICDSSTDKKGAEHNGVSEFGSYVIKEMNRLGMIVDVSHISDKSFFDVLEISNAPVIASHSSVRTECDHPRNMSDEMIKALAKNNGVIQICILGDYIRPADTTSTNYLKKEELRLKYNNYQFKNDDERKAAWAEWHQIEEKWPQVLPTIKDAVDHIDHVVKLVGVDYVGIGSDFDGGGGLADCQSVADFPKITEELIARGYSEEDIHKIWGGNFLRVFKEVEKLRE
ncbi:dipeptidase [Labilibacter marinus]|uniref:dipeptidase n=1 Tax=Labilibacter marinus TaxID=1477105 RepID=UPI00094FAFAC|nr:dipeptidase [Labilibacter marinus]